MIDDNIGNRRYVDHDEESTYSVDKYVLYGQNYYDFISEFRGLQDSISSLNRGILPYGFYTRQNEGRTEFYHDNVKPGVYVSPKYDHLGWVLYVDFSFRDSRVFRWYPSKGPLEISQVFRGTGIDCGQSTSAAHRTVEGYSLLTNTIRLLGLSPISEGRYLIPIFLAILFFVVVGFCGYVFGMFISEFVYNFLPS